MPFYQLNSFSGRLRESNHLQPLQPISVRQLDEADLPKMIWDTIKTQPLKTTPLSANASTLDPKLVSLMKKFQANVEKPVYLLGGTPDKIMFGLTCVLVVGGVAQCFKLFYEMANPSK